jgi:hypothetical protein
VRGRDLSREGSSSGKLVEDVAIRSQTSRLASEGLDEDLHAFSEMQLQVESALLLGVVISKSMAIPSCSPADRSLHLVNDGFDVFKWDNLAVKGGP